MRFTFFATVLVFGVVAVAAGCAGSMAVDAGYEPDAGFDAGRDAGRDGGADAGHDAGPPPYTGCTCGDAGVCGTGQLGDPLRCCNYQEDTCLGALDAGPCAGPKRCSPRPPCCLTASCFDTVSCLGSGLCVTWLDALTPANGTPCDDGRACSAAVPAVTLPDCVGVDGGADSTDCQSDYSVAFPKEAACPRSAPSCSGRSSAFSGNGGPVFGARCCPSGMACDFRPGPTFGKCLGNWGRGTASNDVCRAGVCATDDVSTCP